MSAIKVCNLIKKFGNKTVLDNLNLTVEENELFGFIGRNGAGKSTLINILTGNVHKTSGDFELLNYNESKINLAKLEIGVMPDVSNLYEDMNGFEFLKYMSELNNVKSSKTDLNKLLDLVGLEVLPRMKIKNYSFGMKKKISLAQSLIGNPKLLFLDEPTSGIDPESIIHIQKLISNLNKQGITIFLTSHNLNEIEKLCTSIAILKNGNITLTGSIDEIKSSYTKDIQVSIHVKFASKGYELDDFLNSKLIKNNGNILNFKVSNTEEIAHIVSLLVKNSGHIYSVVQNTTTLEEIFLS